jgi:benzoyl-CoA 2,3-dioxygenase component B
MSDLLNVSYDTKIPNNVGLSSDRKVLKALEKWHPGYIDWWNKLIPQNFQESMVYLRTAVSVDPKGWAKFDYVKMPDYRWGILLAPEVEDRRIPMGEHKGQKAWQEVPGEYRNMLKRLIVIQGDTEPGSVEQQRFLGLTAPSLYDMRNLFQVNVEEGRHLWAMVYLLQKYFGKDGREEADDMLVRSSGSDDSPRMLGAFNEETHHMFVGETGVGRTIQATVDAMNKAGITDPTDIGKIRDLGVIDLPTIQKKLNLHYSLSLDLFGQEVSTNAANAFNQGIKGRYMEQRIDDDHQLQNDTYVVRSVVDGQIIAQEVPALTAINMRLRDDYIRDASGGIGRWNKLIAKAGVDFKLFLPDEAFHRQIGVFAAIKTDQEGNIISNDVWEQRKGEWLPTKEDGAYIESLMVPCYEAGKYATWIAPPKVGIDNKPGDFEYVKLHMA